MNVKGKKYIYTSAFLELKDIVNEVDPIGLISIYCPDDEYDPEVNNILKLIPNSETLPQLADMIHNVFIKWFDAEMAKDYAMFERIAVLIWNKREKFIEVINNSKRLRLKFVRLFSHPYSSSYSYSWTQNAGLPKL